MSMSLQCPTARRTSCVAASLVIATTGSLAQPGKLLDAQAINDVALFRTWSQFTGVPGFTECPRYEETLKKSRSDTTASERYEAAKGRQQCVLQLKSYMLGQAYQQADKQALATQVLTLVAPLEQATTADVEQKAAEANFMGMTFGVGIGFSSSKHERITSATVAADNTVRVTGSEKQSPRVILEAHYYGVCKTEACNEARYGIGPFFGLAAKEDSIDSFALGVMFGRRSVDSKPGEGFSLGIGAVLDREVPTLAPGFVEGQPVPAGETTVAIVKRSRWSPLLFFTKTF